MPCSRAAQLQRNDIPRAGKLTHSCKQAVIQIALQSASQCASQIWQPMALTVMRRIFPSSRWAAAAAIVVLAASPYTYRETMALLSVLLYEPAGRQGKRRQEEAINVNAGRRQPYIEQRQPATHHCITINSPCHPRCQTPWEEPSQTVFHAPRLPSDRKNCLNR